MRAGEQTSKRTIRRRYPEDFEYSERLLAAAHKLHGLLCDKGVRPSQNHAKCVAVGLWMKMCKQHRSILVLCELGLVEDAEIIARSLFESMVQTFFVVKRNVRLRRGWQNTPERPRGGFSMEFRAKLYLARDALNEQKRLNVWKNKPGLKKAAHRISQAVAGMVQDAESFLGAPWMAWLRDKRRSFEAFKVETMSHNLGLSRWYDAVYRVQSTIAHAGDAVNHLDLGSEPMTIDAQLGADIDRVQGPMHLANALCGHTAEVINGRFRLGVDETMKDLAAGARAILDDA